MSMTLLMGLVALVLAVAAGILGRGSTVNLLVCVAVALLALIHVLTGGLVAG
jgi:hypothetical protein